MGLSFTQFTASGGENQYAINFPYLENSDITVALDGADEPFTFASSTLVDITSGNPANGVIVEVRRTTNRATREVDYQNGTNLVEATLDLDSNQLFFVMQEAFDLIDNAIRLNSVGNYDALDVKVDGIGNLPDFTTTYDDFAVNLESMKAYFLANVAAAGALIASALWQTVLDDETLSASITSLGFSTPAAALLNSTTQAGLSSAVNAKGIDVASTAGVMTLGTDGNHYTITGTNAITGIATLGAGTVVILETTGACSFVNSATFVLAGAANITAAAGDVFIFVETETAATWRLAGYALTTGKAIIRDTPTTTEGDIVARGASVDERLAIGTVGQRLGTDGTDPLWEEVQLPVRFIDGLEMTIGTDAAHELDFSAGVCRDTADTKNCTLIALTKDFELDFAEGTAAGGMATSIALPTSGTVHFFVAEKDASPGTFDIICDTSLTMANGVTGWTMRRRIGSRRTNGSDNLLGMIQVGNRNMAIQIINSIAAANPGTSAVTAILASPAGIIMDLICMFSLADVSFGALTYGILTDLAGTDVTPAIGVHHVAMGSSPSGGVGGAQTIVQVASDTSSSVRYRISADTADHTVRIQLMGWIDPRI